jgi:ElaB/YqjD/DUF883 family membrane-anchored ribosome-binding protein
MFDTGQLSDELKALKHDVTCLLNTAGDETFDGGKGRAEALADQIKAALAELGEAVSDEQGQLHDLVRERPVASLASAFALGVVVGFMLRRH